MTEAGEAGGADFADLLDCALEGDAAAATPLDPELPRTHSEQTAFDERAARAYLRQEQGGWWHGHRYGLVESLLAELAPPPGAVLNLGCGTNLLGLRLAAQGYRVAAADSCGVMLHSRPAHPGVARLHGFVPCREVRAGVWDAALALDLLEHLREEQQLLGWLRERLRPGGLLILTTPAYPWLNCSYFDSSHYRRYTRGGLRRALEQAGFEVERCGYLFALIFPLLVAHRLPWMLRDRLGRRFRPEQDYPLPWRVSSEVENRALGALCRLERAWARQGRLPWGSSVLAVARKPG